MREVSQWWLVGSIDERVAAYNISAATRRFVAELSRDTDLRQTRIPGLDPSSPTHRALLAEHLFAPGLSFVEPFRRGIPLGPLAKAQVYSTDAHDEYQGKIHAAGRCQHSQTLRRDDDLVTFQEWFVISADYAERGWLDDPVCSKCGGFSLRLLAEDERSHLELAFEVDDFAKQLEWYELAVGGVSGNGMALGREELGRRREELVELQRQLGSARSDEAATRYHLMALEQRADVLQRRLGMRLGDQSGR